MPDSLNLNTLLSLLKLIVIASAVLYLLVAIGLTMLAAKLRQSGAWMAWIPIANLFLLCRMAQATPALILPAMIPGVGFVVLGYLGARIARRLGKPAVLGAMFGVPVLGVFVPFPLALTGVAPAPLPGSPLLPATHPAVAALRIAGAVAGLVLLLGGGFLVAGRLTQATIPNAQQVAAVLPAHTAGTLTEFPIDTDPAHPVKPTNVITQTFAAPSRAKAQPEVRITPKQLPPWIAPASLPAVAESVASADYRPSPTAQPVTVVVLILREPDPPVLAPPSRQAVAQAGPGAQVSGIEIKSAAGDTYRGYRVSDADSAYYAMRKTGTQTAIMISATEPGGLELAERLARNVGNGSGLLEYEDYRGSFGELPAAPDRATLDEIRTFTEADITDAMRDVEKGAAEEGVDANIATLIDQARLVMPGRFSFATYTGPGDRKYIAAVAGYANSRSSWLAFTMLDVLAAVGPAMVAQIPEMTAVPVVRPVTIGDSTGYFVDFDSTSTIVLRHGGSLVLLFSLGSSSQDLTSWAESYVARKLAP